jgi:F-type H+-transporting ATPase subunit a
MTFYFKKSFFFLVLTLFSFASIANESKEHHSDDKSWSEKTPVEKKGVINEVIQHHLQDSYNFEINGVGFPLPVILWDEGLHFFVSSDFSHGEKVIESKGKHFTLHHGKIYKTDAAGTISMDEEHHVSNAKPLDFSITKNVFIILLMSLFLFFLFSGLARKYKKSLNPGGSAKFLEPLVLFVRDEIAIPNIGKKHYKRFMSFLLTVFFFIWFLNLLGMTPLGIGVTNNIAVTASLALVVFFITTFSGNKNYWKHIFWMPGVPVPMKIILAPIEVIGMIVKPFSLMIRLYANMLAGHVVLMSIIGLIFMFENWVAAGAFSGLTVVLSLLELLVAALQAYIFTMLAALYFGASVAEDH